MTCLFIYLFASFSIIYFQILLRIWDIFFNEGSVTLFRMTLGMLKMKVNFSRIYLFIKYSWTSTDPWPLFCNGQDFSSRPCAILYTLPWLIDTHPPLYSGQLILPGWPLQRDLTMLSSVYSLFKISTRTKIVLGYVATNRDTLLSEF